MQTDDSKTAANSCLCRHGLRVYGCHSCYDPMEELNPATQHRFNKLTCIYQDMIISSMPTDCLLHICIWMTPKSWGWWKQLMSFIKYEVCSVSKKYFVFCWRKLNIFFLSLVLWIKTPFSSCLHQIQIYLNIKLSQSNKNWDDKYCGNVKCGVG